MSQNRPPRVVAQIKSTDIEERSGHGDNGPWSSRKQQVTLMRGDADICVAKMTVPKSSAPLEPGFYDVDFGRFVGTDLRGNLQLGYGFFDALVRIEVPAKPAATTARSA